MTLNNARFTHYRLPPFKGIVYTLERCFPEFYAKESFIDQLRCRLIPYVGHRFCSDHDQCAPLHGHFARRLRARRQSDQHPQASDVTLDLGDFYLFGSGQNTVGVVATDQVNITIKNGGLVGFNTAIILQGSSAAGPNYGHHVENLNISGCANGIWLVHGNQSIVARNQLSNGNAVAIFTRGFGDRIENNDISGYRIGIRSFGGNYIQANFLNYCITALWLGGDDRRKDNVVIRSTNGHRGGDPKDQGNDD
jgi:hypothetical protein